MFNSHWQFDLLHSHGQNTSPQYYHSALFGMRVRKPINLYCQLSLQQIQIHITQQDANSMRERTIDRCKTFKNWQYVLLCLIRVIRWHELWPEVLLHTVFISNNTYGWPPTNFRALNRMCSSESMVIHDGYKYQPYNVHIGDIYYWATRNIPSLKSYKWSPGGNKY